MTGLRELKKTQARQTIADTAMKLFARRGFDEVTVEDIAQAAMVSKKTVFNYFPTKEDLVFAHVERREEILLAAVKRSRDVGAVEAFRELCLQHAERIAQLREKHGPGSGGLSDLLQRNPTLHRRLLEVNHHLTRTVAAAFAEQTGSDPDDPVHFVVAAALVGAQGALHRSLRRRVVSGASDTAIVRGYRREVNRVFDLLDAGFAGYPG